MIKKFDVIISDIRNFLIVFIEKAPAKPLMPQPIPPPMYNGAGPYYGHNPTPLMGYSE